MSGSVRTKFTAGIAAITASAVVLAPTAAPAPRPDVQELSAPPVALAAAVKPLVVTPMTPRQLDTARTVIGRLDPEAASLLAPPAPPPANAASNSIASIYEWAQGWVAYGVELAQYALQFIPYGYLIGNQVGIVYDTLVLPISDSVVYDLVIPVVNDPLNLASWVNGAAAVGSTTVNSFINFGIAEFNYFFGWLIPPLPPIPLAATAATTPPTLKLAAEATAESVAPAGDTTVPGTQDATATDVDAGAPTADPAETVEAADPTKAVDLVDHAETVETADQTADQTAAAEPAESATLPAPTDAQTAAEPASAASTQGDVDQAGTQPVTSRPESEPDKATGTTTTTSSPNGADGSTGAKPAEDKDPDASKGKGGKDGASRSGKPGASAAGGVDKTAKHPRKDADKDAGKDAGKGTEKAKG